MAYYVIVRMDWNHCIGTITCIRITYCRVYL